MEKKMITKLLSLSLMICHISLCAQEIQTDLKKYTPKRFIDKVEVIAGPSLYFPDDNGWSERSNKAQGYEGVKFKSKLGYSVGLGLIHSIGKHFEINGKVLWERKGYWYESVTIGDNNTVYKYSENRKNNCLTFSIAPTYLFGKKKKLYIYAGVFYSNVRKSIGETVSYKDNVVTSRYLVTNSIASGNAERYEAGFLGGFGYSFNVSQKNAVVIQLQGNYGISDIVNVNTLVINSNSACLLFAFKYNR